MSVLSREKEWAGFVGMGRMDPDGLGTKAKLAPVPNVVCTRVIPMRRSGMLIGLAGSRPF